MKSINCIPNSFSFCFPKFYLCICYWHLSRSFHHVLILLLESTRLHSVFWFHDIYRTRAPMLYCLVKCTSLWKSNSWVVWFYPNPKSSFPSYQGFWICSIFTWVVFVPKHLGVEVAMERGRGNEVEFLWPVSPHCCYTFELLSQFPLKCHIVPVIPFS